MASEMKNWCPQPKRGYSAEECKDYIAGYGDGFHHIPTRVNAGAAYDAGFKDGARHSLSSARGEKE